MRLYGDLAPWFHLLTAPADYAVEADRYRELIVEADGRRVGTVFLGRRGEDLWLYDITIDVGEREKGHGRAAMLALEEEVRLLGHESVALNVWGGNEVARGLYRSLGYVEESVHMRKRL